jgi:hypothetical protein
MTRTNPSLLQRDPLVTTMLKWCGGEAVIGPNQSTASGEHLECVMEASDHQSNDNCGSH